MRIDPLKDENGMRISLREIRSSFKTRVRYYRAVYQHPRTPRVSRILLWAALAYAVSPIDIIPDFIPGVGHLDDLVIVPGLIVLALWLIPDDVLTECRKKAC
ncbi:MAG: YkvA family protein [Candidatus Micrarchaeota archaeon]